MAWCLISQSGDVTHWNATRSRDPVCTRSKSAGATHWTRTTWIGRIIISVRDFRWKKWHCEATACPLHWQAVQLPAPFLRSSSWTREVQSLNLRQNLIVQATAWEGAPCSVQKTLFPFHQLLQNQDPPTLDLALGPWVWMIILNCVQGVTVSTWTVRARRRVTPPARLCRRVTQCRQRWGEEAWGQCMASITRRNPSWWIDTLVIFLGSQTPSSRGWIKLRVKRQRK